MSTLVDQLRKRLEYNSAPIIAHIEELWPDGDEVEITSDSALALLAHITKWNHARLAPLHNLLLRVVEAADELIDGIDDPELSDALAALSAAVGSEE